MLNRIYEGHLGMVKNKSRAREVLFWPNMNGETEEKCCEVCLKYRNQKPKQFMEEGANYVIMVDAYFKYIETSLLSDTSARVVIAHMKSIMARHGIPKVVISDNGPLNTSA